MTDKMGIKSDLAGRTAIVTGAGRGVGLAIARRFAQGGARVLALDLSEIAPEELDEGVSYHRVDVSDEAVVEAFFDRVGTLDILVNNAAVVTRQTTVDDLTLAEWNTALAVNLTGAFLMSKHAVPRMRRNGRERGSSIINVASQLGLAALPNRAAYIATKGALAAFSRALAVDHGHEGIRVNTLSPGAVATERVLERHGTIEAAEMKMAADYPLGRIARIEDVAEAALFLASDRSRFMTGSNMVVDGGYSAR
jgi:NAD(P)-dependent dehydrogenase (short-subunit alcohol dehydrogenase family)